MTWLLTLRLLLNLVDVKVKTTLNESMFCDLHVHFVDICFMLLF